MWNKLRSWPHMEFLTWSTIQVINSIHSCTWNAFRSSPWIFVWRTGHVKNEFLIFSEAWKSYSKQQIFSSKKIDYLIVIYRTEGMKASIAKNAFWLGVIATFSGKTSERLCGKTTKIQENFFYVTQPKTFPYTHNKLSFAFGFTEKWHKCPGLGLIAYKTNAYNLFKFM